MTDKPISVLAYKRADELAGYKDEYVPLGGTAYRDALARRLDRVSEEDRALALAHADRLGHKLAGWENREAARLLRLLLLDEPEPVDPNAWKKELARKTLARKFDDVSFLDGSRDAGPYMELVLAGIESGLEHAKKEQG
jgi:hypothetical protein